MGGVTNHTTYAAPTNIMHRYYKKAKQKNPTTYISAHTPTAKEILEEN